MPPPEDPDEPFLHDDPVAVRDARDVDRVVPLIVKLDKTWKPGERIDAIHWSPQLVRPDKSWVLHVHLSEGCPRYISRRLTAAGDAGHLIHVALPMEALYDAEVLEVLSAADAYVYVLDQAGNPTPRRHFLAAIGDLSIPVDPELRRRLARATWGRLREGTENQRGRRLEALIAFLLSQVNDLSVYERNFRSATGEIDVVVRIDNFSRRVWNSPGVPFIHVESKNTVDPVNQQVISVLIRKLQISRGRARLGFAVGSGGFTSDARDEELRLSESQLCIAFFDGETVEKLIDAEDLDAVLEDHVTRAMLR